MEERITKEMEGIQENSKDEIVLPVGKGTSASSLKVAAVNYLKKVQDCSFGRYWGCRQLYRNESNYYDPSSFVYDGTRA